MPSSSPTITDIKYLIKYFISYDFLSNNFSKVIVSISFNDEPRTMNKPPRMTDGIRLWVKKLLSLKPTTLGPSIFLYTSQPLVVDGSNTRSNTEYTILLNNIRLVLLLKDYTQLEGLDYLDTFASMAKLTTIQLLLTLGVINNWTIKQIDINNIFLHADLNEKAYMKNPPELMSSHSHKNQVCKFQRSLYDLKQAGRQWYSKLPQFLNQYCYKHCISCFSNILIIILLLF